ncbi:hypothetical protein GCM10009801_74720 [Streptomyces albiaxialis]|uniref:DUF4097 domain-containing protein n=1 Tax=Streptomyces albiaxialis TaxID=329523 RepID=A0ABP5IMC3_9ACTN
MMRRRLTSVVLVGAFAMGGLAACGPAETFEDDASVSKKISSVRVESDKGDVTLRGRKGGKVAVHREVVYHDDKPEDETHRVEDGQLVLGGCGDDCKVHYTVDVPVGLPVTGETSTGSVDLSRVGAVDLSTGSGDIELDAVSGKVKAHTSNGGVSGSGLRGDGIEVETSNGEVDLTPAEPQNIRAKTSNGEVSVKAPESSYRISVKTGKGDKDIQLRNDPSGRYRLDLTTGNGDVSLKRG